MFQQKYNENEGLSRTAEIASLLYSFDGESTDDSSEIKLLAGLSEQSVLTFARNVNELLKRGLAQQRGQWRAILPHAIANRLAAQALGGIPKQVLQASFINQASERVQRSFSRRLGYLHESKCAQEIVADWLVPTGLLGNLTQLSEYQREMFTNIAPVNPKETLNALLELVKNSGTVLDSKSITTLAGVARLLAYDAALFENATAVLFALHMRQTKGDDAKQMLLSLCGRHFSGTHATPEQRITLVKLLLDNQHDLGLLALQEGLTTQFSCNYSFDFGARKRDYGWQPKNACDVKKWYDLFIGLAVEYGKTYADIRKILGESIGQLWAYSYTHDAINRAAKTLVLVDGWPDGWIGIQHALRYCCCDDDAKKEASMLAELLQPKTLLAQIQTKVLSHGFWGPKDWDKAEAEATVLGVQAASFPVVFDELTMYFCCDSGHIRTFSVGVGKSNKGIAALLEKIRLFIQCNVQSISDFSLLTGVIHGWNQVSPEAVANFFDEAMTDEIWGKYFPRLQCSITLDQAACDRLIKCCELRMVDDRQFRGLHARVISELTVPQLASILEPISQYSANTLRHIIEIIKLLADWSKEKSVSYQAELRQYCMQFIAALDWSVIDRYDRNNTNKIEEIMDFALAEPTETQKIVEILNTQLGRLADKPYSPSIGEILRPFFKRYPIQTLDACYTVKDDVERRFALKLVSLFLNRQKKTAVSAVPDNDLIDWCNVSPTDRYEFAARTCKVFEDNNNKGAIADIALKVFANSPNKAQILTFLLERTNAEDDWTPSSSSTLETKFFYLEQFRTPNNTEYHLLLEQTKVDLQSQIDKQKRSKDKQERSRTARFE